MELVRYGEDVRTIFDLFGSKENDMTFGLGWVLTRSEAFLRLLIADVCRQVPTRIDGAIVRLQTGRGLDGITDIEIEIGTEFAIIIEAKKGPQLPTSHQLARYATVLTRSTAKERHILALTNASVASAGNRLECPGIAKSHLHHRSWRQIRLLAEKATKSAESHANKQWLRTFCEYVGGLLEMEMKHSNRAFVVSLGGKGEGWSISYRDVVEKKDRYFFPVGNRWPDPPPNYLAFRYDGRLQSIHHVKSYVTFTRPSELFLEAPKSVEWPLHYCVNLGPAIKPPQEVLNGPRIKRNNRVYCMLDTLLTNKTISDALTETERRERSEE
jgi:hypothetical protein